MFITDIFQAIALVLILEGIIPFLFPNRWLNLAQKLAEISSATIRTSGAVTLLTGAILLFFLN